MYEEKADPVYHRKDEDHHQRHHGLYGGLGGQVQKDENTKHREQVVAEDATPTGEALVVQDQACRRDGEGGGKDQQKALACNGA